MTAQLSMTIPDRAQPLTSQQREICSRPPNPPLAWDRTAAPYSLLERLREDWFNPVDTFEPGSGYWTPKPALEAIAHDKTTNRISDIRAWLRQFGWTIRNREDRSEGKHLSWYRLGKLTDA